jgi:triacylglycerol esterase/lipase EstA (alpha/beta hydrolase family)
LAEIDAAAVRSDLRAAAVSFVRALARPASYAGIAREALWTGAHFLAYPTGLLIQAAELELDARARATRGERALRSVDPDAAVTPIVLIHGYGHNRSAFIVMRRALRRYGFAHVTTWNYSVLRNGIPELAEDLAAHVEAVCWVLGVSRVHLVGHSLGGVIARYYVQRLGGARRVDACVTLASPHKGSVAAVFGRGRIAAQLRPGSELLRSLNGEPQPEGVRFFALYSNLDGFVIPASSAMLDLPGWHATNVFVRDEGHLSMPGARRSIRCVLDALSTPREDECAPASVSSARAAGI